MGRLKKTILGLALGSLVIVAYGLLALGAFWFLPFGAALIVIGAGGFFGMMLVFVLVGSHPNYSLVLIPLGLAGGWNGADWIRLEIGEVVTGIAVHETDLDADVVGYHWTDGRVLAEYTHHALGPKDRRTSRRGAYIVAPVVGETWTAQQPVRIFAVCGAPSNAVAIHECRLDWAKQAQMAEVVVLNTALFFDAVELVRKNTPLQISPEPILVRWTASIDERRLKYRSRTLGCLFGFLIFWNVANIRNYWRRSRRAV